MPNEINLDRLRQRQDAYLTAHYTSLHVTVVSLALGMAGVSAASLLSPAASAEGQPVLLWLLWASSLLAASTAYAAAAVGSPVLPAKIPSIWDLALPLALGVVEFLMFALLAHQVTGLNSAGTIATAWFLAVGLFGAIAVVSILRIRHLFHNATYATDAAPLITWYIARLRREIAGASTLTVLGVAGMLAKLIAPGRWSLPVAYTLAGVIPVLLIAALIEHGRTGRGLRQAFD